MTWDDDTTLLKRFEPVICYTRGERFFPMNVQAYIQTCSLWKVRPGMDSECLIPEGDLTVDKLSNNFSDEFGTIYYLRFIEPLNIREMAEHTLREGLRKKDPRHIFKAGRGRLARVGYLSRVFDAIFSLSLLARGRVPGDTAAAAIQAYGKIQHENEHYCYYGRVIRRGGWICLQYWFFYPFNNWRSGFFGVNDHEADWEMICVYLSESDDGQVRPEWVAYAMHDFSGDDLRRRWDDPELDKRGEHPVIYAGAGSHASYYLPGEYLTEIELPFLSTMVRLVENSQKMWGKFVSQTQSASKEVSSHQAFNFLRVPFVDYARGDGVIIGVGGDKSWDEPHLLDPAPDWLTKYRGLWGYYARDPIAGENAPAGPVYNRDGAVRRSWYDPLGWAGMDKIPPPNEAISLVERQCHQIEEERTRLAQTIAEKSEELVNLGVQSDAMQGQIHLAKLFASNKNRIASLSEEVKALRAEYATKATMLEALNTYKYKLQRGEFGDARAHLHRIHRPASDTGLKISRLTETWSAVSIGLTMLSFVLIYMFARHYLLWGMAGMVLLVIIIEASFRQQLTRLISQVTIGLALFSGLILTYEFFWSVVVIGILTAGLYLLWENIIELRT